MSRHSSETTPELRIHQTAFSGDIDHTVMTGGTLDIRKIIEILSETPQLYIDKIALPIDHQPGTHPIHKGMHTLEHTMAYAGGLRDHLQELTKSQVSGAHVLDISPFVHEDGRLGFRLVSAARINPGDLAQAIYGALRSSEQTLLAKNQPIPFATPEQCGQFTFHDRAAALRIIEESRNNFAILPQEQVDLEGQFVSVADLRLLKPELRDSQDQSFLTPDNSYALADQMEHQFTTQWQELGLEGRPAVNVGTYGCMTGHYVIMGSNRNPVAEKSALESQQHIVFTRVLNHLLQEGRAVQPQEVALALNLIAQYSPGIFTQALL